MKITRALISVSDKTGVVELAKELDGFGVKIISTGGTAKTLRESRIDVTEVSEITGFPEMMDGRVKTLHPKIHGAFLALRDNREHVSAMNEHGIEPIDLVVVNLYPFEKTIETGTKPETNIKIKTPIIYLSKAEIVKKGFELNAPLHLSWSCYRNEDLACGNCDSCALRLHGFEQAGVVDPIKYKI